MKVRHFKTCLSIMLAFAILIPTAIIPASFSVSAQDVLIGIDFENETIAPLETMCEGATYTPVHSHADSGITDVHAYSGDFSFKYAYNSQDEADTTHTMAANGRNALRYGYRLALTALEPNTDYEFSFWMKFADGSPSGDFIRTNISTQRPYYENPWSFQAVGTGGLITSVTSSISTQISQSDWFSANTYLLYNCPANWGAGTLNGAWVKYTYQFTTGASDTSAWFSMINTRGVVYIDDVTLVKAADPADATLSSLTASGVSDFVYDDAEQKYIGTAPYGTTSTTIAASASNPGSVISGDIGAKTLAAGINTFFITVTAPAGNAVTYTVEINVDDSLNLDFENETIAPFESMCEAGAVYKPTHSNADSGVTQEHAHGGDSSFKFAFNAQDEEGLTGEYALGTTGQRPRNELKYGYRLAMTALEPNTDYEFSFWMKFADGSPSGDFIRTNISRNKPSYTTPWTNSAGTGGLITSVTSSIPAQISPITWISANTYLLYNCPANWGEGTLNGAWVKYTYQFTTGASDTSAWFSMMNIKGIVYIDDVSLSAVVYDLGDVNGDGTVDILDLLLLKTHLLGGNQLTGAYLEAAKLNDDDVVDQSDFNILANMLLKK